MFSREVLHSLRFLPAVLCVLCPTVTAADEKNSSAQPPETSRNPNSPSAAILSQDETLALLRQPVTRISVQTSVRAESLGGTLLRQPENVAAGIYRDIGSVDDDTPTPGQWRPNRNLYPICHNPLYFEDPNLERCGRGSGILTDAVSAAHFFGRVPLVPYLMGANHPRECVRALPDRPMCQSYDRTTYLPDPDMKSLTAEELAVLGVIFLIP